MREIDTSAKTSTEAYRQPEFYEIRIQGHLADRWRHWFEGLTITLEDKGVTLLTGPVVDQAALHGFLKKVRDLGMPLLSLNLVTAVPKDRISKRESQQQQHSKNE